MGRVREHAGKDMKEAVSRQPRLLKQVWFLPIHMHNSSRKPPSGPRLRTHPTSFHTDALSVLLGSLPVHILPPVETFLLFSRQSPEHSSELMHKD